MRVTRCLAVLLAALAVAGCARRQAPSYVVIDPATGRQVAVAQQPMVMQQPAAQRSRERGLFNQPPVMQAPRYPAPRYQAPVVYQAPVQAPVYQAPPVQAPSYAAYQAPVSFEAPYTLDSGDRLRISVFGQDGLTNSYAVDAAGYITMPLIGPVPARGLTPEQLSQSVSGRLRQGYIREPHVALEIEAYRPFFILGEVTTPGQYPYVANMTVETAIAIAGGFAPRAEKSKVALTRSLGGQTTKATVPLNYPLRPGDTLRVQERWF